MYMRVNDLFSRVASDIPILGCTLFFSSDSILLIILLQDQLCPFNGSVQNVYSIKKPVDGIFERFSVTDT